MKNITITIDDATHRAARVRAAEMGTSVSALVKLYLQSLIKGGLVDALPTSQGVREMPIEYKSALSLPPMDAPLPPNAYGWTAEGKPYYTKDGKPRKPGGLKGKIWVADDFDEWPQEMLDYFEELHSKSFDDNELDQLP